MWGKQGKVYRDMFDLIEDAQELKKTFPKLTDFEALIIASKNIQNEIFANAFGVVGISQDTPSALEYIHDALKMIAEAIEKIKK